MTTTTSVENAQGRARKSVITCDLEGRIETFNPGAERIFGYRADEVVGKKRVSLFSPGLVVLEHVPNWLKTAQKNGEYQGKTVFVRKDGTPFAAEVRITTTHRDGEQLGYCGVTKVLEDTPIEEAMPQISLATRLFAWLVILRAPFLTATLLPVLIGAAWASWTGRAWAWWDLAIAFLGGAALHIAANTFNDYYDWKSGTDQLNNDYVVAFTGGSRAVELGLIRVEGFMKLGIVSSVVALGVGGVFTWLRGPEILLFGLAGLFTAFFYTAPPLRLVARRGLGELFVGLNFGPLMVAGTVYALTGQVGWLDFWMGVPIGLLTSAILWANEFPDAVSDAKTGKNHLVVTLGKGPARWGYLAITLAPFAWALGSWAMGWIGAGALLCCVSLPAVLNANRLLFKHCNTREVAKACVWTIQSHLFFGVTLAVGVAFL